jgi:tetratricopeptide (TPR) repeat protein
MSGHKSTSAEPLDKIEAGLGKAELFVEQNRKNLIYGVIAIIIVVSAFFAYRNWYKAPLEEEAQAQLFQAQQVFETDSLQLALDGDGSFLGFVEVADRYSNTAAGNTACFYAGISYLHLGQYDDALTYLKKYSGGGLFGKALALGNIGDAYSELGEFDDAVRYYKKAAAASNNPMTAPRFLAKAALVLEQQGEYSEASKLYEKIQHEYFNSSEANDAEKRIARLKILQNNK